MPELKIEQLIRAMNKHEANSFEKYLRSPFFNSDPKLLPVFRTLFKKKSDAASGEKQKKISGNKSKEFRYHCSFLSTHLENFYALRDINNAPMLAAQISLNAVAKRDAEKSFSYLFQHFRKQTEKSFHDEDYYYHRYKAFNGFLAYTGQKKKRKHIIRFDEAMRELDKFYVSRKLQLVCEIVNAQNVISAEYKVLLLDEIKELVANEHFNNEPSIDIYYKVLLTLTEPDNETHIEDLQSLIKSYSKWFSAGELNNLYLYLKNYCIKKLNQGVSGYLERLFEIYKLILNDSKVMKSDYLSQWEFKNIVSVALRLKETKWTQQFIDKYLTMLHPREQRNARIYNIANLSFHLKNYKATLKLLQNVEFSDLYYQLDARTMMLKLYFETDDDTSFFSQVSSFRVFLSRNKLISSYQRSIYRNFIKYSVRLHRAGAKKTKLQSLLNKINSVTNIGDKRWIEENAKLLLDSIR